MSDLAIKSLTVDYLNHVVALAENPPFSFFMLQIFRFVYDRSDLNFLIRQIYRIFRQNMGDE